MSMTVLYIILLAGGVFGLSYVLYALFDKKKIFDKWQLMLKILEISDKTMGEILAVFDKDPNTDNKYEKMYKIFDEVVNTLKSIDKWYTLYIAGNDKLTDEEKINLIFDKAWEIVNAKIQKIYKEKPISSEVEGIIKFLLENGIKLFFEKKNTQ